MGLIVKLLWVVMYVVCTFAFVVLFDHGPENYQSSFMREVDNVVKMV